jgi:hypothetical protein
MAKSTAKAKQTKKNTVTAKPKAKKNTPKVTTKKNSGEKHIAEENNSR